ncbi:MAG: MarR family transcriptional regulator [Bacteroidales bacterium]|nr:MarR family transcriptional regulator [Bacteroidales bacterium]
MTKKQSPYCQCLYYSANALARILTKIAEEEFGVTGLSPSHAFVVMSVNKNPGMHAGELAEMMMLTPSTVTRLVEKLEQSGFLKRVVEGRSTLVFPTKSSVDLDEIIRRAWLSLYQRYISILGEEDSADLTTKVYNAALLLDQK